MGKRPFFSFQNICYKEPTCDTYILHNLQEQLLGFRFMIGFLNTARELIYLIAGGISSPISGPIYETDYLPL